MVDITFVLNNKPDSPKGDSKMYKKRLPIYMLLTLLVFSTLSVTNFPFIVKGQTTPTMYVDPELTTTQTNTIFSVNMSIAEVTDLCSWQLYLYFKKDIISATEYAEGPFLQSHGSTMLDGSFDNNYNETHGELWMYCLRTWSGTGVTGSGTLATITFKAKMTGTSPLNLVNTILGNSTAQRITHTTTDGEVEVGRHDVAIISVVPCKTIVCQGYPMSINVTVENQGNYTETFNITTYANTTTIQTQTLTLAAGSNPTVAFTWNTTDWSKSTYTISAAADIIPGETDTDDNMFTDGTVKVTVIGNVNGDGVVDIFDLVLVANAYGSSKGDPSYIPNADINDDGTIDIFDLVLVSSHYGETDP